MYKFRFKCSDEDSVRAYIERRIASDTPCGKGIFGRDLYGEGVHFSSCGECVDGFFLDMSEGESFKGTPLRACFKGRFVKKNNELYFEGYIYPRMHEALIWLFLIVYFSIIRSIGGLVMTAGIATILLFSYYDKFKRASSELELVFI